MGEAAEIRHLFVKDRLPQTGKKVELLCNYEGRPRILAFFGAWSDDGWVVADTKRRLEYEVIGWRNASSDQQRKRAR